MLGEVITLTILLSGTYGYPTFQTLIPNGQRVPNPCNPAELWPGVGHKAIGGGGERNPFGLDFYANNKVWTKALCEKDSDEDGRTNGEELGDPGCIWQENDAPQYTTNLSHPGVCEPLDSPVCQEKNNWLECPKEFQCPDFEKNSTESIKMVIPRTNVPANETTYVCQAFKMPNDKKYHAIGMIPEIDNKEVMHHMVVYGCGRTPSDEMLSQALPCGMSVEGCPTIIGIWSVGQDGECHPEQYGFPIGANGFQHIVVQLHWNNPQLKPGMTDASGITLYYTDKLRANDAMVITTGQQFLLIPPQLQSLTFEGACTAQCTKYLNFTRVNISAAFLHMHLLGKSGRIEMLRDGRVYKVLANESSFDYNTPITVMQDPPIEFRAGDEIKVTCEFQSMTTNKSTHWGEGTQDEMCYGFITIYPSVQDFDFCGQWEDLAQCTFPSFDFYGENDCNVDDFNALLEPIARYCQPNCSHTCMVLMNGLYGTGCMYPSMWKHIELYWPLYVPGFDTMVPIIKSCWPNDTITETPPSVTTTTSNPEGCNSNTNAAQQIHIKLSLMPMLVYITTAAIHGF